LDEELWLVERDIRELRPSVDRWVLPALFLFVFTPEPFLDG
jgi:hypothetical protein